MHVLSVSTYGNYAFSQACWSPPSHEAFFEIIFQVENDQVQNVFSYREMAVGSCHSVCGTDVLK